MKREQLETKTVAELRRLAANSGASGVSRLKKAELVDLLATPEPSEWVVGPAAPKVSLLGSVVQGVGVAGFFVSVVALFIVPLAALLFARVSGSALQAASESAANLSESVRAARQGLDQAGQALETVHQSMLAIDESIEDVDPLLLSVSEFLGGELTDTIVSTHSALVSAEEGAAAIDGVLRGLRLLGVRYNPDQPLQESLAETASSLEPLPTAFEEVELALDSSRRDIGFVRDELSVVADETEALAVDIRSIATGMTGYSSQLHELSEGMRTWAERMPWVAAGVGVLAALVCLWLISVNLAVYYVGHRWREEGHIVGGLVPSQ
jgi:hypothetical protein